MPPNRFESEVESFLEGSHGDRTHIKRADHHTVTPLCGTLLIWVAVVSLLTVGIAVRPRRRPRALWPGLPVPPAPSAAVGPGVLLWLAPSLPCMRYRVRPARVKCANLGHFERAGRVLSRTCGAKGCAGRVLYRSGPARFLLGEFCPAVAPSMCPVAGLPPPTGAAAGPSSVLHADAGGGFAALGAG